MACESVAMFIPYTLELEMKAANAAPLYSNSYAKSNANGRN